MRDSGLDRAIQMAGGVAELARRVGIRQPSVSNWSRVPAERVAAVLVPREGRRIDEAAIDARLREDLSAYKVPAELHVMAFEDIPRTDAGKVRKPVLRERFLRNA